MSNCDCSTVHESLPAEGLSRFAVLPVVAKESEENNRSLLLSLPSELKLLIMSFVTNCSDNAICTELRPFSNRLHDLSTATHVCLWNSWERKAAKQHFLGLYPNLEQRFPLTWFLLTVNVTFMVDLDRFDYLRSWCLCGRCDIRSTLHTSFLFPDYYSLFIYNAFRRKVKTCDELNDHEISVLKKSGVGCVRRRRIITKELAYEQSESWDKPCIELVPYSLPSGFTRDQLATQFPTILVDNMTVRDFGKLLL